MLKIRENAFETNSSSCHSLVVNNNTDYGTIDTEYTLEIELGEYGWGYEKLSTPSEKASYMATLLMTLFQYFVCSPDVSYDGLNIWAKENYWTCHKNFFSLMREQTGAKYVEILLKDSKISEWGISYGGGIDHQSCDSVSDFEILLDKDRLKELIFGNNAYIIIDNDNH